MTAFSLGQRYIAAGAREGTYELRQVPGNALGAYLDGAKIEVFANVQDAAGDTMNDGEIVVHGSCGDATGYAMRGGTIFVEKDAGYRCGIHMKEYGDKSPQIVIGGRCGSFLGEYQAGGIILVLGIGVEDRCPVGNFCGTGMHGGKIVVRSDYIPENLPDQVVPHDLDQAGLEEIMPHLERYCSTFGVPMERILPHRFYALTPNTASPYKRLYAMN